MSESYTVRFNPNGGIGDPYTQTITVGEGTALTACFFYSEGESFIGWAEDSSASQLAYSNKEIVTDIAEADGTIDLYAIWSEAWDKSWGWLIKDGNGVYYTVEKSNDAQIRYALSGISDLSVSVFKRYGFQFTPDSSIITDLYSPTFYLWSTLSQPTLSADADIIPIVPQSMIFKTLSLTQDLEEIDIVCSESVLWNVSFDRGNSWYKHTGANWQRVTANGDGCTKWYLERLSKNDWAEKCAAGNTVTFRCWLGNGDTMTSIRVDYLEDQ